VPPPKQTDFLLRPKAVEHTVLVRPDFRHHFSFFLLFLISYGVVFLSYSAFVQLPSLSIPPLSTPFDKPYLRDQSEEPAAPCLEFPETVMHATPTAFGLKDPSLQDTYVRP
jgi:hypothetical protein